MKKTHAMRLLDSKGIPYRVTEYDSSGSFIRARRRRRSSGRPREAVYKTLVVLRDGPPRVEAPASTGSRLEP